MPLNSYSSLPLLVVVSTAVAFSPSQIVPYRQHILSSQTVVSPFSRLGNLNTQQDDADEHTENNLTALEGAQILSYRAAIGASALLISTQALGDVSFFDGTGFNVDSVVEQSGILLPVVTGTTLVLCPLPKEGIVKGGALSLGILNLGCGLLSISMTSHAQIEVFLQASWSLSMLALMAVSFREIWYFGIEYKQECVITLLTLALMLDLHTRIPFTVPLCALGMSVLAAGKVFEPLREDLTRSNSEFLAK